MLTSEGDGADRPPSPSLEIEELRSMIEQFQTAPFFFEAMKDDYTSRFATDEGLTEEERLTRALLLEDPRNVSTLLGFQKELFSKLKVSWLHHASQEKFLKNILALSPTFYTDEDVEDLSTRVSSHKEKLKEKKKFAKEVKEEVQTLAERVVEGHARLQTSIEEAEEALAQIDEAEKQIGNHEASVMEEKAANEITIADASTLLAEINTAASSIQAEIDEWKAKIAAITGQNEQLAGDISDLKAERDRAFKEVDEAERIAMKKDLRLEEYGEWLKAQQPLLSSLLGVDSTTVLPPSDLEITFRPLPPLDDGTVFRIRVLVNETSADRVVDISAPGCPEHFEDILDAANSHICAGSTVVRGRRLEEKLPLAVRECVRRVRCWHARGCEVRALKAAGRYDLSELDLRRLAVTFRSGVQFVVSTEPDYPKGGGIELIEVRKADGKLDVQTFKELKGRMANEKITTIMQMLERLGR